MSVDLAT
jgi:hypothetical protein